MLVPDYTSGVPDWDYNGLIPASDPDAPVSRARSPYAATLPALAARFGHTEPRRRLLFGLLDFRAALRQAGLERGFQWIDGSFVTNIEETAEQRAPNDIDVVTFLYIPDGHTGDTLTANFPTLFDRDYAKANYSVDAYFAQLNAIPAEEIIAQSTYWYSLWSHTRDRLWKGYLQVSLSGNADAEARTELARMETAGGRL